MTDQKKIRDLIARMVSMAPEPPPFPQEIVMSQNDAPSRRSPALIFGVAALAVVALALPLFLWNNQGDPVGGETTTTTTVPTGSSTTTTPGSTTTSTPASSTTTAQPRELLASWPVFFVQAPQGSNSGNPALVPFDVSVYADEGVALDLVNSPEDMLFNLGSLSFDIPAGFTSAVPEGVEIVGKTFETTDQGLTRAVLDMNEAFLEGAAGLLGDFTMLNQIIYTTLQFEVAEVRFTVGGQPVTAFGSEGLSLVDPVDSSTFRDELNPVILITPVSIGADGNLRATGVANVFEAVVNYRLDGEEIGYTMASCGTGCWGLFELTMDVSGIDVANRQLQVFTESAQDGSPIYVITIPLAAVTDLRAD